MENKINEFNQEWKHDGKEFKGLWKGICFWTEDKWVETLIDMGNLDPKIGYIVGIHKPIRLNGGYHNSAGEGLYEVYIEDEGLMGVHESRLTI
jgi:hypothetical protein